MKLSIVIPAHNEEKNIGPCVRELQDALRAAEDIPYEIIVVDDNSRDATAAVVEELQRNDGCLRLVRRQLPAGFGRAIRSGLAAVTGEAVIICMADLSDRPEDVITYYRKLQEGYDCVYGSRFLRGSTVENYPPFKYAVNRLVNRLIQVLFLTRHNDLTNAFKAYRADVLQACGPPSASHFNITIELSLGPVMRGCRIATVPIAWRGRLHGVSNLKLWQMGRRYLATLLCAWLTRWLIADDLIAEWRARRASGTIAKS